MAKFLLKGGAHYDTVDGKKVSYYSGDIVESDKPLDTMFVGKFTRLTILPEGVAVYEDGRMANQEIIREKQVSDRQKQQEEANKLLNNLSELSDKELTDLAKKHGIKVKSNSTREELTEQLRRIVVGD